MAIQINTHFSTLMRLAKAVGDAKKAGDPVALAKAQAEHDAYRDLCLKADVMHLGVPVGSLL